MFELPNPDTIKIDHASIDQNGRLALLYHAMCNGGFYGFDAYGLGTKIENPRRYKAFNVEVREDRLIQYIAEGETVSILDMEDDCAVVGALNLESLNKNFDKVPANVIMTILNENDDAETGDQFLQYIIFGELVYG